MAELATAASLAGLISLAIEVTKSSFQYASSVKYASSEIASLIRELEVLNLAFEELGRLATSSLSPVASSFTDPAAVNLCQQELVSLRDGLQKKTQGTVLSRSLSRLKWPLVAKETREMVQILNRYRGSFHTALSADAHKINSATLGKVTNLDDNRLHVRRQQIIDWLASTDPSTNHVSARTRHEPLTGQWLFRNEDFNSWLRSDRGCLWIEGIPGCGKTILCSTIIDHLLQNLSLGDSLAYFYFDFSDHQKQSFEACIQSLIAQHSSLSQSICEEVQQLYDDGQSLVRRSMINAQTLRDAWYASCKDFGRTTIVLDALDECRERDLLLNFLSQVSQTTSGLTLRIKWLLTSRREREIEERLTPLVSKTISLKGDMVDPDIRRHVATCLKEDQKLQSRPQATKMQIEQALVDGAHGM
jgi:ankyrin repeat domain-containing protein 50